MARRSVMLLSAVFCMLLVASGKIARVEKDYAD
jgi:hypothetical protein